MIARALAIFLLVVSAPASAWEARHMGAICTLDHSEGGSEIRLTYDPSRPLYTIAWTIDGTWPPGTFAIAFDGARPNVISTDRHGVSDEGRTVRVSDRGFGNVLDGLRFNETATAISGDVTAIVSLEGASAEVDAFLTCEAAPSV